jgi:peptide/nickel transport system substrate-binding protein
MSFKNMSAERPSPSLASDAGTPRRRLASRIVRIVSATLIAVALGAWAWFGAVDSQTDQASDPAVAGLRDSSREAEIGRAGGELVVSQRAEVRTFNPLQAADNPSREILGRLHASLVRINRATYETEPDVAESWSVSDDGRRYVVTLRRDVRFSDGHALDADDVVFTFHVHLDAKVASPQRDLLVVQGTPIRVERINDYTIAFTLAAPYAAAERLFDGIAILPRHLLEEAYRSGALARTWTTTTPPDQIAGLGPFRLEHYVPGERVVLTRNPHYWKVDGRGTRLPYLDRLTFITVPSEDAQAIRFQAGDTHVISRFDARHFMVLTQASQAANYRLIDLGASLEYTFLFFNLNHIDPRTLPAVAVRQRWFTDVRFRRAVSAALDRDAMVRLVYQGRATPLWWHVSLGNRRWFNGSLPRPPRSLDRARSFLREAGFSWTPEGTLVDAAGQAVAFTIITNASNQPRVQLATLIQDDLRALGMRATVVPLEFRAVVDRVTRTHDYDAAILGLGGGDVDPNPEMNVWLSSGNNHLWHPEQASPATPWEAELDGLMQEQLMVQDPIRRKAIYDRVQAIVASEFPIIALVSPNVLAGAHVQLGNVRLSILPSHTLWNADELYWRNAPSR